MAQPAPLDDITIIDLTRVLAGPYCTMLLADMGARVIKVEQPGRGDDTRAWGPPFVGSESAYFLSVNRNKESITLDFKHPLGRQMLERLIHRADVVVENFRPGTLARFGLDYASLSKTCPTLIYCAISGFGQTGPQRERPGYDAVVQAEGGLMSITGAHDGPPYRLGVAIGDLVSGMFAAQGIALALLARSRTGRGQLVDVAMLDSVVALLTYQAGAYFATGEVPVRMGNRHPMIVPYESFPAADGDVIVTVGNDEQWKRFCVAADVPQLADDPCFSTNQARVRHYHELKPQLDVALRRRTRRDWLARLTQAGVPCGSVRGVAEISADEQIHARNMIEELHHPTAGVIRVLGVPVKLSDTPGAVRRPPPCLGEHTDTVLSQDLNLSKEEIGALRKEGVI